MHRSSGFVDIPTVGHSMAPLLRPSDTVRVSLLSGVGVGDVVVFLRGRDLIVHRVLASRERQGRREFLTKGDARSVADGYVPDSLIVGKVVGVARGPTGRPTNLGAWWWRRFGGVCAMAGWLEARLSALRRRREGRGRDERRSLFGVVVWSFVLLGYLMDAVVRKGGGKYNGG